MFKKIFTAAWIVLLLACCQLAAAAPTVSVNATPSNPMAPATVTLAVTATSDGNPVMATQVEYFNGSTSLGASVQTPFTLTLDNLAAGTYQIIAKVTTTDPANPVLQSAPLAVTVGTPPGAATAYFIHTDQLNTPRAITNGGGNLVWQWDSDPFGKDAANEQPAGQPAFTFNQRFPGQQFDRESNLHYNYLRDYDPALGRYIESDPIGLRGGVNTYAYVGNSPLAYVDPYGLARIIKPHFSTFNEGMQWANKYRDIFSMNEYVREKIKKLCPNLLKRFDDWEIYPDPNMDNPAKRNRVTSATTKGNRTVFNYDWFNQTADDPGQYPIFMHEFRHISPVNQAIGDAGDLGAVFSGKPQQSKYEQDADEWARRFIQGGNCECK